MAVEVLVSGKSAKLQERTVSASTNSAQHITPSAGYDGLSKVTVRQVFFYPVQFDNNNEVSATVDRTNDKITCTIDDLPDEVEFVSAEFSKTGKTVACYAFEGSGHNCKYVYTNTGTLVAHDKADYEIEGKTITFTFPDGALSSFSTSVSFIDICFVKLELS